MSPRSNGIRRCPRPPSLCRGQGRTLELLLRKLEQAGLIERRPYSERPPRYEYLLTDSGNDLHPILLALKEWGDRYCNPGAEPVVFEHTCGATFHPVTVCAACQQPIRDGELTVTGGTHPVEATI
jgi:HxlR-like helix-turn-helix protein